eukprot:CAMPEP_0119101652 /NCGR_PEP_ID=MMETSP1180-20130426/643_1 /TAXON_ID=3052 ORGANISM="Chlamydomonas cf sp, Strain CCMP681" /NCGR_SAMPLE_ID=MMETSP1180 /ASSEMBLY_ACC=CAM_ASM_000741 /LENGTH=105 /DNA_ID=CAMNT_0007085803 /DNA_START=44 /DNA_END=361 /DNA_ORIENTATION=+
MSAAKRAAQSLIAPLRRGLATNTAPATTPVAKPSGVSHAEICYGDGHSGIRKGYHYDWEHGPHYISPSSVPNFQKKWNIVMPAVFGVAIGIPIFAVWWQQRKLKA